MYGMKSLMMRMVVLLSLVLTMGVAPVAQENAWSRTKVVAYGPAEVVGGAANGCVGGAVALPASGTGYVNIRRHRNRFYAHPETIDLIKGLGKGVAKRGKQLMMVGDMAQPRGGRMASMHRSHQNGLDADIWFMPALSAKVAWEVTPEGNDPSSMLDPDKQKMSDRWGQHQLFLIQTVAENPKVDRIFANAVIKKHLCKTVRGDRSWLQKVRPWWGHHAHFHLRLKCPKGSPDCKGQGALPKGDGCGSALAYWLRPKPKIVKKILEKKKTPKVVAKKRTPRVMPPKCQTILAGSGPWSNKLTAKSGLEGKQAAQN